MPLPYPGNSSSSTSMFFMPGNCFAVNPGVIVMYGIGTEGNKSSTQVIARSREILTSW